MGIRQDIRCLALTIHGEARGEILRGRAAVACVVMNRVARRGWYATGPGADPNGDPVTPFSIAAVCLHPAQFSAWNKGDGRWLWARWVAIPAETVTLAEHAIHGLLRDVTYGADHYYACSGPNAIAKPRWATRMTETAIIGNHAFYRDE